MVKQSGTFEVFENNRKLYTRSLNAKSYFSEPIIKESNVVYREWIPFRSKLCAAILKGCKDIKIRKGSTVLYLGASHGYTPSYVSDIIGNEGMMFCVDIAPRPIRNMVFIAQERKNIIPILANANNVEQLAKMITPIDIIFQDIAHKDQVSIFMKNMDAFVKPGGFGLISIKARSIDISKKPSDIYRTSRTELEKKYIIVDYRTLEPFQIDHCFMIVKKK